MRRNVLLLLCSFYLLPLGAHADDNGLSAKDIKTLFFGHDDRKAVSRPEESPWDAIGQLETASGNLCGDAHLPQLALTAGHCLLTPPRGKPDKAVALRFISRKGTGCMRSTALTDEWIPA
jgi:protease YdgD